MNPDELSEKVPTIRKKKANWTEVRRRVTGDEITSLRSPVIFHDHSRALKRFNDNFGINTEMQIYLILKLQFYASNCKQPVLTPGSDTIFGMHFRRAIFASHAENEPRQPPIRLTEEFQ